MRPGFVPATLFHGKLRRRRRSPAGAAWCGEHIKRGDEPVTAVFEAILPTAGTSTFRPGHDPARMLPV